VWITQPRDRCARSKIAPGVFRSGRPHRADARPSTFCRERACARLHRRGRSGEICARSAPPVCCPLPAQRSEKPAAPIRRGRSRARLWVVILPVDVLSDANEAPQPAPVGQSAPPVGHPTSAMTHPALPSYVIVLLRCPIRNAMQLTEKPLVLIAYRTIGRMGRRRGWVLCACACARACAHAGN